MTMKNLDQASSPEGEMIYVIESVINKDSDGRVSSGKPRIERREVTARSREEAQQMCDGVNSEKVVAGPFDPSNDADIERLEELG